MPYIVVVVAEFGVIVKLLEDCGRGNVTYVRELNVCHTGGN